MLYQWCCEFWQVRNEFSNMVYEPQQSLHFLVFRCCYFHDSPDPFFICFYTICCKLMTKVHQLNSSQHLNLHTDLHKNLLSAFSFIQMFFAYSKQFIRHLLWSSLLCPYQCTINICFYFVIFHQNFGWFFCEKHVLSVLHMLILWTSIFQLVC